MSKSAMTRGVEEMDKNLAEMVMGIKRTDGGGVLGSLMAGLLRLGMLGLSLISGPVQTLKHLLGMLVLKIAPESRAMSDFMTWLDNSAQADIRAMEYFREKGIREQAEGPFTPQFPSFENQFSGV